MTPGILLLRKLYDPIIIKIEPRDRPIRLWMYWLFLNRNRLEIIVYLNNAKTLRVFHRIPKNLRTMAKPGSAPQHCRKAGAKENVVAKNKATRIARNKILTNDKSLANAIGLCLDCI